MNLILAVSLVMVVSVTTALSAELDLKAYNITADGKTDASSGIQKAMDDMASRGGGKVLLPAGSYRLDKSLTVPSGVTLSGVWEAPHHAQLQKGTVFLVYAGKGKEDDPALINLSPSSTIAGVTFFYPEQKIPAIPYPWTIQGEGMHGSVKDVTLVNAYKGIDFGTKPNELHYIRNVFGCPLKTGVFIDKCTDIGRIENVHFNPHYWMRAEVETNKPSWPELRDYIFNNCTAFEIGRSDWEYIHNTFSFGCKYGYRFFKSADGPCNGNFLGIAADWAQVAVYVEETQEPGLLITNGEFVGGEGARAMLEVAKSHTGAVQFSNSSFWGPSERIAIIDGTGSVSMNQCNFVFWKEGFPAVEARNGDVTIQACRFRQPQKAIVLGPDVKTAVIMGNRMQGEIQIDNNSKGDVQIGMNVARK